MLRSSRNNNSRLLVNVASERSVIPNLLRSKLLERAFNLPEPQRRDFDELAAEILAAATTISMSAAALGFDGFARKPSAASLGTISFRISTCFGRTVLEKAHSSDITARITQAAHKEPNLIGSAPIVKMTGIVAATSMAARGSWGPPVARRLRTICAARIVHHVFQAFVIPSPHRVFDADVLCPRESRSLRDRGGIVGEPSKTCWSRC